MLFRTITLFAIGVMVLFGVLNLTLFNLPSLAWFDLSIAGIMMAIRFHVRYTPDSRASKMLIGGLIVLGMVLWLNLTRNTHHAFYWMVIIPPTLLFLLGKKWGTTLSCGLLAYFVFFTSFSSGRWSTAHFSLGSLFNISGAFVCLTLLIIFYENSRTRAYQLLFEKSQELEALSCTDSLTKLRNRYFLQKELDTQVEKSRSSGTMFSLILIDVNAFKHINDTYGHHVGDSALQEIGLVLCQALTENFHVGRWGGDEFLVICPNTSQSIATNIAKVLREKVKSFDYTHDINCSISTGVSTYKRDTNTLEATLIKADQALYRYKQQNRQQQHNRQQHKAA